MFKNLLEKIRNNKMIQLLIVLCGAILFYTIVNNFTPVVNAASFLFSVISPLFSGIVIAYLLRPIVYFFEYKAFHKFKNRNFAHILSVIITVILMIFVLLMIVYLVVPQLAESVILLASGIESYANGFIDNANAFIDKYASYFGNVENNLFNLENIDWKNFIIKVSSWIGEKSEGIIGAGIGAGKKVANTLIAIMFAIYILLDNENITKRTKAFIKSFMQKDKYEKFSAFCTDSNRIFMSYLGGNLLDSLIIGIMCYIFMVIMKLPYAFLVSVVVALTNLIPTFGPIIGLAICGFLILIVSPIGALWFTIYTIISQFLDANVIKPILFGDSTGLSPLWVLASIIIAGGLFGVVGMLLGVPIAAIIVNAINAGTRNRLIKRGYISPDDVDNL